MIKEIYLKNFKCFDELKLSKLKTFNVIAGKNNYGKTSILDSIFAFYGVKNPGVLLNIKGFRKEDNLINPEIPFWVEYFRDMNASSKIIMKIRDEISEITQEYSLPQKQRDQKTMSLSLDSIISQNQTPPQTSDSSEYGDTLKVRITETKNSKNKATNELFTITTTGKGNELTTQINQSKEGAQYTFKIGVMVTTSKKINKETMITSLSNILTKKRKQELIAHIKKIDNRINDIAIVANGASKDVYLDIGHSEMTEISMLGEGVSRALAFISLVIEQKNSIILIDEIENGIHYSVIMDIIKSLIHSAKSNGNQIFTTTHSNDVVNAINNLQDEKEDISYIRIGRDKETGLPSASLFDMEDFSYSVESGWEVR